MTAVTTPVAAPTRPFLPVTERALPAILGATVAVAALAPAGAATGGPATLALLAVVVLVGIPHGALDHLVGAGPSRAEQRRFHLAYLAAIAAYGLVWFVAPAVALVGFLGLSVHHFGQSDLAHLGLGGRRQVLAQLSHGLVVVGLPLAAHPDVVAPVVAHLGVDVAAWRVGAGLAPVLVAALVAQHVAVLGLVVRPGVDRGSFERRAVAAAVLVALLVRTDPLVGFATYFGLWHSLAHLGVLDRALAAPGGPRRSIGERVVRLARLAAPRTAAALAGLAAVVAGAHVLGRPELVLPAVLVVVSLLTPPHLVVVQRLWAGTGEAPTPASGRHAPALHPRR